MYVEILKESYELALEPKSFSSHTTTRHAQLCHVSPTPKHIWQNGPPNGSMTSYCYQVPSRRRSLSVAAHSRTSTVNGNPIPIRSYFFIKFNIRPTYSSTIKITSISQSIVFTYIYRRLRTKKRSLHWSSVWTNELRRQAVVYQHKQPLSYSMKLCRFFRRVTCHLDVSSWGHLPSFWE